MPQAFIRWMLLVAVLVASWAVVQTIRVHDLQADLDRQQNSLKDMQKRITERDKAYAAERARVQKAMAGVIPEPVADATGPAEPHTPEFLQQEINASGSRSERFNDYLVATQQIGQLSTQWYAANNPVTRADVKRAVSELKVPVCLKPAHQNLQDAMQQVLRTGNQQAMIRGVDLFLDQARACTQKISGYR